MPEIQCGDNAGREDKRSEKDPVYDIMKIHTPS